MSPSVPSIIVHSDDPRKRKRPNASSTTGREREGPHSPALTENMGSCANINTKIYKDPNMPPEQTLFCDNCSGRWDRIEFWHSCPSDAEASQEKWGHVLLRKFGEIEKNGQCRFCRLICYALTKRGRRPIPKDTDIYFSKLLFGEYESRSTAPWGHRTASQFGGLEEPTWLRHFVNHLCVSTFPSQMNVERDYVWLTRGGIRLCEYYECHIALLRANTDNHRFLHGRRINSAFDMSLAKQWIETCNTAHSTKCLLPRVTKQPSRVINIKEKRIQYTPSSCSYIALSYRWSTSAGLILTSATEDSLMKNGGLAHFDDILPVVKDSMALLEKLGQTYLWVDALCIPQEKDPQNHLDKEREDQIGAMADIYHGANFTIVACSDPDSKKGLPGIRDRTRSSQKSTDTDDLAFAIAKPDLVKAARKSQWNSRFWTFQEAAQSRRLLIFTDHQVFFHCNGAMWREDAFLEIPGQQDIRVIDLPPPQAPYWRNRIPQQQLEFREWVDAVETYTKRRGTKETDFPRGLEFIKPKNCAFCCLPEKYFALALCFVTWRGKRRTLDSPTWCWCRWRVPDGVKYESEAAPLENSADKFHSRSFYKVGYDSTEHILFPIRMDNVQPTSFLNAMEVSSIHSRVEIPNLVVFCACILKGSLLVGEDGLGGDCTILFPFLDPGTGSTTINVHASAILALDCDKDEGDPVTCADVGLDVDTGEVWLLVVEIDDNGISRRIGTATIGLTKWESAIDSLEKVLIFLA